MSEFPNLKSGAVAQYPAGRTTSFSTLVWRFVDGSEQRCREFSSPLRQWIIRLEMLDEMEMAAVESFFESNQGALGEFSFTDPWDGAVYPNCSVKSDEIELEQIYDRRGKLTLVIEENRS